MSCWGELEARADQRCVGVDAKRRAHRVQAVSSVVFLALATGLVGRCGWLAGLFVLEALGQALLAWDGARGMQRGAARVTYFASTGLGRSAAAVLLVGVGLRWAVAFDRWGLSPALLLFPLAASLLGLRTRSDFTTGASIAVSGFGLGSALLTTGATGAGAAQLAYGALLIVGVLALRPWFAEVLNVGVFGIAAFLLAGL
ncbi:MAG: hypothetical protein AB8I08_00825 [Sandaracinaceae bacterium]